MAKKRRRGAELEQAIFAATRSILEKEGLSQLTFAKVAEAAETSKPVIYRHWDSPFALALLAIQDKIKTDNNGRLDQLVLTGNSLAEDLLQVMKRFALSVDAFGQAFINTWFIGLDPEQTKQLEAMIHTGTEIDMHAIDHVLTRARERGEIKRVDLNRDIKLMPFDWMRYQRFINEDFTESRLKTLVDDILVPAYLHALND